MVVVGAFARIDKDKTGDVIRSLNALTGVETFDLHDPAKVGILIETKVMERAHQKLIREIRDIDGILGVWPIYIHNENGVHQKEEQAKTENG